MASQQRPNPFKRARSNSDRCDRLHNKMPKYSNCNTLALSIMATASPHSRKRTRSKTKVANESANPTQRQQNETIKPQGGQTVKWPDGAIECEEAYDADMESENDTDVNGDGLQAYSDSDMLTIDTPPYSSNDDKHWYGAICTHLPCRRHSEEADDAWYTERSDHLGSIRWETPPDIPTLRNPQRGEKFR